MQDSENKYFKEALTQMKKLACDLGHSFRAGYEHFADETAHICMLYENKINQEQITVLAELRIKLLLQHRQTSCD